MRCHYCSQWRIRTFVEWGANDELSDSAVSGLIVFWLAKMFKVIHISQKGHHHVKAETFLKVFGLLPLLRTPPPHVYNLKCDNSRVVIPMPSKGQLLHFQILNTNYAEMLASFQFHS